jgi:phage gpG-like protein
MKDPLQILERVYNSYLAESDRDLAIVGAVICYGAVRYLCDGTTGDPELAQKRRLHREAVLDRYHHDAPCLPHARP